MGHRQNVCSLANLGVGCCVLYARHAAVCSCAPAASSYFPVNGVYYACRMGGRGEMVDAIGLGPIDRKVMGVQVPPSAHNI